MKFQSMTAGDWARIQERLTWLTGIYHIESEYDELPGWVVRDLSDDARKLRDTVHELQKRVAQLARDNEEMANTLMSNEPLELT